MNKISFSNGEKTYIVNGNEEVTITFNPLDLNILKRIEEVKITPTDKELSVGEMDKIIKEKIDNIFNADISSIVFGDLNCMSIADGKPIYLGFLDSVIGIIATEIEKEKEQSKIRVDSYLEKLEELEQ